MIDFRYHIVSLISVFIALAVGIVLGAGPLRDYIADSLTGQVDQLRQEKDELRASLDEAQAQNTHSQDFVDAAAEPLLAGILPQYSVALLILPGADDATVEGVSEMLSDAGASIDAQLDVTGTFTSPGERSFRSGIAGNITAYMSPEPADDASTEFVLGSAIGQALTSYDPYEPKEFSAEATSMYELLLSSELIAEQKAPSAPVDAIVLIAPAEPGGEEVNAASLALARSLAQVPGGFTVLGRDSADGDLVRTIRADNAAADAVTTVDSPDQRMGLIITPRALAVDISGTVAAYGFAEGVETVLPTDPDLEAPVLPEAEERPEDSDENAENSSNDTSGGNAATDETADAA